MDDLLYNPSFMIYCLAASALCLNLFGLWAYSGAVRGKTKTTPNAEDAARASNSTVSADTPPAVARVLRAHANATANIVPFLILALLYVLLGATPKMAWICFGGFTGVRYLHTFFYLREKQPWRSIAFGLGGLIALVVLEQVTRAAIVRLFMLMG
jgi:glutathione S-transferase